MADAITPAHTRTKATGRARLGFRFGSNGLLYVLVGAVILAGASLTQNNLLFGSMGLMMGGLAVSGVMAWGSLRGIEIRRLLPDHAVAGEPLVIRYQLVNRKRWLPVFNLMIEEAWGPGGFFTTPRAGPLAEKPSRLTAAPMGWLMHLGPGQTAQAEALCWPRRRGPLVFEKVVVSTSFPFGLIRRTLVLPLEERVLIYPRLYRVQRAMWYRIAAADPAAHMLMDRGGGSEEFYGLRRYRPGDSLRNVDWKHSAKTNELISRENTQPSPPRLMLALDLRTTGPVEAPRVAEEAGPRRWKRGRPRGAGEVPPIDGRELAIAVAASLICGAHLQGYQVGLMVIGVDGLRFRVHHSLPHRTRMLEALALLDLDRVKTTGEVMPAEPTVTVRIGGGESRSGRGRGPVLDALEMANYTREVEGGTQRLLARGVAPRTKRQRLREVNPWT